MANRHAQRGTAMVEFSIAASVLLFVLLAIMEFGQALYVYNLVTSGARLGARYAIVHGSMCTFANCPAISADIQTYVRGVSPNINPASLTVTATWSAVPSDSCNVAPYKDPGCLVTVTASYPFQSFGPFRTMAISSTSKMYISR
jgi:Flp pilus assembly protein TadG